MSDVMSDVTRNILKVESGPALEMLWGRSAEGSRIYALLDASRDPRIRRDVVSQVASSVSLLRGPRASALAASAPYLVELQMDVATRVMIPERWGRGWGIFLESSAAFADVEEHLRGLLRAQVQRPGKTAPSELYFRYYDPLILRAFLPTCDRAQLQQIFGPVRRYCVESEAASETLSYSLPEVPAA
jgi:Domain of unknown function (DUF4123)